MDLSSLTDKYRSKLKVLKHEKDILEKQYEQTLIDYIYSEAFEPTIIKDMSESLFLFTCYLCNNYENLIAHEDDYTKEIIWDKNKVEELFKPYGKAIDRLMGYLDIQIIDEGMSFSDFFEILITDETIGNYQYLVELRLEPTNDYHCRDAYLITNLGLKVINAYKQVIEKHLDKIMLNTLSHDYEVIGCMQLDTDFAAYMEEKYSFDLSDMDYDTYKEKLPEKFKQPDHNLWTIYLEFLENLS